MWSTVARYLVLLCLLVAAVGVAHLAGLPRPVLMGLMVLVYIAIGLFTAASHALFMDLTDPRLGATQFSTFMAATNGCEAWAAWTGGRIAGTLGYGAAFLIMPVIALTGLLFLRGLAKTIPGGTGVELSRQPGSDFGMMIDAHTHLNNYDETKVVPLAE